MTGRAAHVCFAAHSPTSPAAALPLPLAPPPPPQQQSDTSSSHQQLSSGHDVQGLLSGSPPGQDWGSSI